MATVLLQINLNHARQAQDLFVADLAERDAGLGVAVEPYQMPDQDPNWVKAPDDSVAIVRRHSPRSPPLSHIESGRGFVIARWGTIYVVGVYAPPNRARPEFEQLEDMGDGIRRCYPNPVLVAGDFNAWSRTWSSRYTNLWDELLIGWAAKLDLQLINRGSTSTWVRARRESIVDFTWANPLAARLVSSWKVVMKESLSDHLLIEGGLCPSCTENG